MATSPKDTSLSSAFRYAIDQPLENMATTFQALGMEGWEKFMRDLVEEPENYEAAAGEFINAQGEGFNWEYFPRAVFEQAGQIAGSILARGGGAGLGLAAGGPGGALAGALIGPALFEAIQIAGPVAMERARNNDREEPNWDDWKGALSTSAFSGALNAVGIRNVGVLNNIGKGALGQAGKQVVKGGVSEGVTEGFQGAAEQIGGSALTRAGLQFDPKAAVGEGLLGAGAGTGTQVGTEILGQVAPPTQDGTLYFNPFTKLFGKKKKAEEEEAEAEGVSPYGVVSEDMKMQEEAEKAEAEAKALAKRKYPELSRFLEPVEIDMLGTQIGMGTGDMMDAADLDAMVPRILDRMGDGIKEEDLVDATGSILNYMSVHIHEFADREMGYGEEPDSATWKLDAIDEYVDREVGQYYAEEKTEDPGKYEFDKPRDLYNQPPPVVADYTVSSKLYKQDILPVGSVQPVYTPETEALMRNSPKGSLSTTFMSHSPLEQHIKSRIPKGEISAKEAMEKLFIELGEGKGASKHGKFKTTDPNKDRLATEAIEAKIGDFLLDRMNANKSVTRQELLNVLQDHRSRFDQVVLSDRGYDVEKENYRTSANPDIEAWRQGKFAQYMAEEVKKSDVLPEGYDPSKADAPTDPLPNGEDRFLNEFVDVVEPKIKKRVKKAEKGLPGLLPFLPPKDPSKRAIEPFGLGWPNQRQTFSQFKGQGQPALRRVGEDMELVLRYDARVSPEIEQQIQEATMQNVSLEVPSSFYRAYAEANKLKREDSAYHTNPGGHGWVGSGTLGWSRGGMFSHGEGFKGYLMTEIQSGIHGQSQSKRYANIGYRSKKKKGKMNAPDRRKHRTGRMMNKAAKNLEADVNVGNRNAKVIFRALFPDLDTDAIPYETALVIASPRILKEGSTETIVKPILPMQFAVAGVSLFPHTPGKGYSERWIELNKKMGNLEKTLPIPTYKKSLKKLLLERQPLLALGIEFKDDAQLDAFLKDSWPFVSDYTGVFDSDWQSPDEIEGMVPGSSSKRVIKSLVDAKFVPVDYQADTEVLQTIQDYVKPAAEQAAQEAGLEHVDTVLKAAKPFAQELMIQDPNMAFIYNNIRKEKAPGQEEFKELANKVGATSARERDMRADYPLKGTFGRAKLQADIVSTLMHDPDVTHIYIPTASKGEGPTSPYTNAIKEAKKIAKAFGLDFKELTEAEFTERVYNEETERYGDGPVKVYALEIGPLREKIILEGGFPGYQKGGLVKKATNQVLNYGDYGRRYI